MIDKQERKTGTNLKFRGNNSNPVPQFSESEDRVQKLTPILAPTLSVVIPAFNVESFIGQAIESVLLQSFRDLEVIVVDDGSTDETLQMITRYQDPRIHVIHKVNAGLSAARNTGIRLARGKFIALLDGDDIWFPGYAELHVNTLETDSDVGFTYNILAYIDEADNQTGQLHTGKSNVTLQQMITRNHIGVHVVVRRECFEMAGLFNEALRACEDHEMWVRILHRTKFRAKLIPFILSGYRIRAGSLTTQFDHQIENARKVTDIFALEIGISTRIKRRCLAEYYRVCSRKALTSGQRGSAARLMAGALQQCPWIILTDLRALATFCLVVLEFVLPERICRLPYEYVEWLMKVGYQRLFSKGRKMRNT